MDYYGLDIFAISTYLRHHHFPHVQQIFLSHLQNAKYKPVFIDIKLFCPFTIATITSARPLLIWKTITWLIMLR